MHDDRRFILRRRVHRSPGLGGWFFSHLTIVPFTFMVSTYDGTLGALAVVTMWLFVVAIKDSTTRWSERATARRSA